MVRGYLNFECCLLNFIVILRDLFGLGWCKSWWNGMGRILVVCWMKKVVINLLILWSLWRFMMLLWNWYEWKRIILILWWII